MAETFHLSPSDVMALTGEEFQAYTDAYKERLKQERAQTPRGKRR